MTFPLKPGAVELLAAVRQRGVAAAIASSTPSEIRRRLRAVGIQDHFDALAGGDEVVRGKPAPDIFLAAAARIGEASNDCVVLEDSEPGLPGAHAAGITPIIVPDLHPPSADLLALEPLVLASLHLVRDHLASLPR